MHKISPTKLITEFPADELNPDNTNFFSVELRKFEKNFPNEKFFIEFEENFLKILENEKKKKIMQQVQNIQEKRNASIQEIDNKNIFSQTYVLYNENGMVKPTFVSELNQEMNVFSEFTIFREKTIKKQKYSQETTKNFF